MALAALGKKRICNNCSTKFYDMLKKDPIKCPHCNEVIETEIFNLSHNNAFSNPGIAKRENRDNQAEELANEDQVEINNDLEHENDDIISLEEVESDEKSN